MNRKAYFASAILWATAVVASALLGASPYLTAVILPTLAATALTLSRTASRAVPCPPTIEAD